MAIRTSSIVISAATLGFAAASPVMAAITATFPNGSNFDSGTQTTATAVLFDTATKGGVGANQTYTDLVSGDAVTITTVEMEAPLYDLSGAEPVVTSTILKASTATSGFRLLTNAPGSFNAIGIDSEQLADATPFSSEHGQINYLEAWIFEFDQDVILDQIAVSSVDAADAFEMRVEGVATVFSFVEVNTGSGPDVYGNPLGGLLIPAGTDLTFRYTEPTGTLNRGVRITSMTVSVPEPVSLACFSVGALALLARQRRRS